MIMKIEIGENLTLLLITIFGLLVNCIIVIYYLKNSSKDE